MPGANYMGGRRNAAKARIKDATTRAEKSHFGKQRILATSLNRRSGAPSLVNYSSSAANLVQGISLAHARRDPKFASRFGGANHYRNTSEGTDYSVVSADVPYPGGPIAGRLIHASGSSESSSKRRSAILDELDTSHPVFLRAEMNRIMTLPDLAGLTQTVKRRRRQSPSSPCGSGNSRACSKDEEDTESRFTRSRSPAAYQPSDAVLRQTPLSDRPDGGGIAWGPDESREEVTRPLLREGDIFRVPFGPDSDFEPISFGDDTSALYDDDNEFSSYVDVDSSWVSGGLFDPGPYMADRDLPFSPSFGGASSSPGISLVFPASSVVLSPCVNSDSSPTVFSSGQRSDRQHSTSPYTTLIYPRTPPLVVEDQHCLPCTPPSYLSNASKQLQRQRSALDLNTAGALYVSPHLIRERLWDVLRGRLFDDADPWTDIKTHLGILDERVPAPDFCGGERFAELQFVHDRRGVGYGMDVVVLDVWEPSQAFDLGDAVESSQDSTLHLPSYNTTQYSQDSPSSSFLLRRVSPDENLGPHSSSSTMSQSPDIQRIDSLVTKVLRTPTLGETLLQANDLISPCPTSSFQDVASDEVLVQHTNPANHCSSDSMHIAPSHVSDNQAGDNPDPRSVMFSLLSLGRTPSPELSSESPMVADTATNNAPSCVVVPTNSLRSLQPDSRCSERPLFMAGPSLFSDETFDEDIVD
ncbi:hypothetical protein BXZ70DRAFT_198931 [Cristinia sonorae]|uniref:Uncharacterized protein n=1 Tax=Cristinia sonorae TaxID=1940300 RepID=A0A8K0UNH5_9AGAR|nr:hypothetical protein BXZ70DRAFT_198931 [Cristinia sonorae]